MGLFLAISSSITNYVVFGLAKKKTSLIMCGSHTYMHFAVDLLFIYIFFKLIHFSVKVCFEHEIGVCG